MKATFKTEDLKRVLEQARRLKQNRILPITSFALVKFSGQQATMTYNNLTQALISKFDCETDEEFAICLPCKTSLFFLRGDGPCSVELIEQQHKVILSREGVGSMTISQVKGEEFPPVPLPFEDAAWTGIDAEYLSRMFSIAAISAATEESRPVLTTIFCANGAMASADGFRLTSIESSRLTFGLGERAALVPRDTALLVANIFPKGELEVCFPTHDDSPEANKPYNSAVPEYQRCIFSSRPVYFRNEKTMLASQLVQGNFPQYKVLVPKECYTKFIIDVPLFLHRLSLIDPITLPSGITKLKGVKGELADELTIAAGCEEEASYEMKMPVKVEKEDAHIAFNSRYLREAVKPFSQVTLEITNPSAPGKITGDLEELTMVIMPMYVQW